MQRGQLGITSRGILGLVSALLIYNKSPLTFAERRASIDASHPIWNEKQDQSFAPCTIFAKRRNKDDQNVTVRIQTPSRARDSSVLVVLTPEEALRLINEVSGALMRPDVR